MPWGAESRLSDPELLREQYSDSSRLRVRIETHRRHGTNPVSFPDWVLDQLDPPPGCSLLDAGCGYGNVYHQLLASRGVQPIGLDRSPGMLREAAPGCHAVLGDLVALPFADGAFDRVMCNHVLYHVPDREAAMRELERVTRPGGRVVISTNSDRYLRELHEIAGTSDQRSPFRLEDVDEVRAVFPDAAVREFHNELVFDDAQAVVDYVATSISETARLETVRERVQAIVDRDGAFRTETVAGCFVAELSGR
jgi:ubiquinone/menaquinone biosynthesis C-methylase UbiE